MSVIAALQDLLRPSLGVHLPEHEERITVASLFMLVAHADGRLLPAEADGLRALLAARFGLSTAEAASLFAHVADLTADRDFATALIDRIRNDVPYGERGELLALAYRVAAMDGTIHEFEDDLIWRTGRLLGFSDGALAAIKADADAAAASGQPADG